MKSVGKPAQARLSCAGCGLRFEKAKDWLAKHNAVPCPGCGKPVHVRRYKAQAGAAALFRSLTGFSGGSKGS